MKKIILVLVVVLTILPLFRPGLFNVHDPTSIIRFFALKETLADGQLPAAWTNLLNQGLGYPLFLYYAPVFSYLGVLIKLVVPSYLLSLKIALVLMVAAAALGMYKLMRESLGGLSAMVASVAYTLLPYHAETLYVRGSYAEGMTWAILPWLLYFWGQETRDKHWVSCTTMVTSLFFLSHNSLPFVFIPFLLLWITLHGRGAIKKILLSLSLSLGLSLWFLLPVLLERNLVQIEQIATSTSFADHFLTPSQLWHSPWGYGGSSPLGQVDGMSFMLGKFQILLAVLGLTLALIAKKLDRKILFFLGVVLFYSLMATTISAPIWHLVTGLSILQFPWRLLIFASFGLAALSGYLIEVVPAKFKLVASAIAILGLIFFNLKFFAPESYLTVSDQDLLSQEKLDTVAAHKIPEYLPATMTAFATSRNDDGLRRTPTSVSGELNLSDTSPLIINTAYMPQWQMKLNGLPQPIKPSSLGLVETVNDVHSGHNTILLTWRPTIIEKIGLLISVLSVVVVIGLLIV